MRWLRILFIGTATGLLAGVTEAQQELKAGIAGNEAVITIEGAPFITYKFAADQKYPYFWPVIGPASGTTITTESSEPYPHHHSLFFGCDRVNGANFWQEGNERGQIASAGPRIVQGNGARIEFTDECLWRVPGQEPMLRDTRRVVITAPNPNVRVIDFALDLEMLTDVVIERTNHSLFAARVVPELSVEKGGTLVNAEGASGEDATFGKPSLWMDYFGTRDGKMEGIAIIQHPGNPGYPTPWFTRDYGFFSPTRLNWIEEGRLEFPKGHVSHFRYRVVVHAGTPEEAGVAGLAEAFIADAQ